MLRIWIEPATFRDAEPHLRISIEHATDGRRVVVSSYDELPDALRRLVDESAAGGDPEST